MTPNAPADDIALPAPKADVRAAMLHAHDVLHSARAMLPESDAGHAEIGAAMRALREAAGKVPCATSASLVADILKDCCECERPNHWDVETVELRVSDLTMILERHIEGKE